MSRVPAIMCVFITYYKGGGEWGTCAMREFAARARQLLLELIERDVFGGCARQCSRLLLERDDGLLVIIQFGGRAPQMLPESDALLEFMERDVFGGRARQCSQLLLGRDDGLLVIIQFGGRAPQSSRRASFSERIVAPGNITAPRESVPEHGFSAATAPGLCWRRASARHVLCCCSSPSTLRARGSPRCVRVYPHTTCHITAGFSTLRPSTRAQGGGQAGACWREGGAVRETRAAELLLCVVRDGKLTTRGSRARAGEQGGQHPDAHIDGFVLNSVLVHLEHADGRVELHRRMMQFDDHPHLDPNVPREVRPAPSRAGARQPAQRSKDGLLEATGRDSVQSDSILVTTRLRPLVPCADVAWFAAHRRQETRKALCLHRRADTLHLNRREADQEQPRP